MPTLVICGDPAAGGAVTLADGDAVASANPNVRLVRIAGPATTRTATTRKPSGGPSSAGSQFLASLRARNCFMRRNRVRGEVLLEAHLSLPLAGHILIIVDYHLLAAARLPGAGCR